MSPDGSRRAALATLGGALAACGFAPAYGPGGTGDGLRGRIAVALPDTSDGYALRARLEDRLGLATTPAATLTVGLEVEAVAAALTPDGAITRYDLDGAASWRLAGADGPPLAEGRATGFTGYSATGSTVATRAAAEDARARLMILLADAIVARLLLLPPDAVP